MQESKADPSCQTDLFWVQWMRDDTEKNTQVEGEQTSPCLINPRCNGTWLCGDIAAWGAGDWPVFMAQLQLFPHGQGCSRPQTRIPSPPHPMDKELQVLHTGALSHIPCFSLKGSKRAVTEQPEHWLCARARSLASDPLAKSWPCLCTVWGQSSGPVVGQVSLAW